MHNMYKNHLNMLNRRCLTSLFETKLANKFGVETKTWLIFLDYVDFITKLNR